MTAPRKVHGSDLSHHNPDPDLKRAKAAGLLWLYHKCTEGTTVIDKTYGERRAAARAVGLPFGAYHFARPDDNSKDAVAEARFFFKQANPQAGDLSPCLDFEVKHDQAKAWAKAFMAEISRLMKLRGLTGKPIHYGPDDFGKEYDYLRWVPRYSNANTPPKVRWDIWQFSDGNYGVPKSFPGLGNVDLNTMRDGLSLSDFRVMARSVPRSTELDLMHISMQFSDSQKQKLADAKKIFARAKKRNVAWITGTEAGAGSLDLQAILRREAGAHGFTFYCPSTQDSWIAVNRKLIKGDYKLHWGGPVIPSRAGRNTARGVVSVSFQAENLGRIHVIASHLLRDGIPGHPDKSKRVNATANRQLVTAIGRYAKKVGKGSDLVFYGGDQNNNDRLRDTFLDQPLTSAGDELKKWPNTGHGPIDVIASYDADARSTATYIRSLGDRKFFLNTDHFLLEVGYRVRHR